MPHLDAYNRPISYLRISVTDRCNLRCVYCMPPQGVVKRAHDEILRYEEIETVVRAAAELGITKVRLTGGEPLVRPGIVDLVHMLTRVKGIDDLAMTTNGILLTDYAKNLARAGLQRVNVSLDTLRPERFERITRRGSLENALAGMEAAHEAELKPVKINTVVIRGLNDDEVVDFARKTIEPGWHVRFIELMPIGNSTTVANDWQDRGVPAQEIKERIESALGKLIPAKINVGNGPARYYCLPSAKGTVGFITPISEHFCTQCNRLRLTADGHLRPCLLSEQEIDLRTPLRAGVNVEQVKTLIVQAIKHKPMQHHLAECETPRDRAMSEIGG
jgi:cyclic pyranopterin phosphate synthase